MIGATLGVLVAGGAGSRLGLGVPKALARLGGVTLLERATAILAPVCDEIVVTAPAGLPLALPALPPAARGGRPPRRIDDAAGAEGPLAGIVAGLAAGGFERAIVLGVDLPFAEPAALASLAARLGVHDAVVPVPGGFAQPLAAAYAPPARAILAASLAAGERSPSRALAALDVLRLTDEALAGLAGGIEGFFNLNTRADLEEAERRLAKREASR